MDDSVSAEHPDLLAAASSKDIPSLASKSSEILKETSIEMNRPDSLESDEESGHRYSTKDHGYKPHHSRSHLSSKNEFSTSKHRNSERDKSNSLSRTYKYSSEDYSYPSYRNLQNDEQMKYRSGSSLKESQHNNSNFDPDSQTLIENPPSSYLNRPQKPHFHDIESSKNFGVFSSDRKASSHYENETKESYQNSDSSSRHQPYHYQRTGNNDRMRFSDYDSTIHSSSSYPHTSSSKYPWKSHQSSSMPVQDFSSTFSGNSSTRRNTGYNSMKSNPCSGKEIPSGAELNSSNRISKSSEEVRWSNNSCGSGSNSPSTRHKFSHNYSHEANPGLDSQNQFYHTPPPFFNRPPHFPGLIPSYNQQSPQFLPTNYPNFPNQPRMYSRSSSSSSSYSNIPLPTSKPHGRCNSPPHGVCTNSSANGRFSGSILPPQQQQNFSLKQTQNSTFEPTNRPPIFSSQPPALPCLAVRPSSFGECDRKISSHFDSRYSSSSHEPYRTPPRRNFGDRKDVCDEKLLDNGNYEKSHRFQSAYNAPTSLAENPNVSSLNTSESKAKIDNSSSKKFYSSPQEPSAKKFRRKSNRPIPDDLDDKFYSSSSINHPHHEQQSDCSSNINSHQKAGEVDSNNCASSYFSKFPPTPINDRSHLYEEINKNTSSVHENDVGESFSKSRRDSHSGFQSTTIHEANYEVAQPQSYDIVESKNLPFPSIDPDVESQNNYGERSNKRVNAEAFCNDKYGDIHQPQPCKRMKLPKDHYVSVEHIKFIDFSYDKKTGKPHNLEISNRRMVSILKNVDNLISTLSHRLSEVEYLQKLSVNPQQTEEGRLNAILDFDKCTSFYSMSLESLGKCRRQLYRIINYFPIVRGINNKRVSNENNLY